MIRGKVQADLSGPVGITKQIAKAASRGMVNFVSMLAMLSVYLGLFNLLPLPALDGGRAVFLGVESVMRKRVDPRIEAAVHTAGFVLLFGVLLVVTFKDIFGKG
jgi:regulator of sigma E protease